MGTVAGSSGSAGVPGSGSAGEIGASGTAGVGGAPGVGTSSRMSEHYPSRASFIPPNPTPTNISGMRYHSCRRGRPPI